MQRIALTSGTVLQLNNREYIINELLGDGATCMVYSAFYRDAAGYQHRVNVKECYPYHARIVRDKHGLEWEDPSEKAECFCKFRQAYDKLMTWQNNSTVTVFDLCEANNTLYIVMNADCGQPFDQEHGNSLRELLQTALALTKTVQNYHRNGYLHLDIKPSNFLTIPETRELVILFDLGSIVAMQDISLGKIHCVSYSEGWAAPEQKQGKIKKLCPATDIYAIGAILFEKVMDRSVAPADMSIFADWDFEGELFENVNPKVKRVLRKIFRKTLAANAQRRYQSTKELAEMLETACEVASAKQFIVAPDLQIPAHFMGREEEIQQIHGAFKNGTKAVFLHGIGGIGKSTLAVAYALSHKNDYDTILFCRYKNSLVELLDDLVDEIQNFECYTTEERQTEGRRKLKHLLDKDTLLIVDNFDVAKDKDPYLHQFLKLNSRLLFTTRTNFEDQLPKSSVQVEVSALPYKQLEALFAGISGIVLNTAEKQQCLAKLLKSIDYHTYITELLARQIVSSGWSLELLTRKVQDGLNGLTSAEKVLSTKDDHPSKRTIPEGLRVLFNLAALDEHSKQVLRNMYLLDQFTVVDKATYKLFCASKWYDSKAYDENGTITWYHFSPYVPESSADVDVINKLCELGWIQEKYTLYSLHPLVSELIHCDLRPCQENCAQFYAYMNAVLLSYMYASTHDEADEREKHDQFELMLDFFAHVDFTDGTNRKMAFDFLDHTVDLEEEWIAEPECEIIAEKLLSFTLKANDSLQDRFRAYLLLFRMRGHTTKVNYDDELWSKLVFVDYENIIRTLNAFSPEEKPKFEKILYTEIKFMLLGLPNTFIQFAYTTWPEMFDDWDAARKDVHGLPVSAEEWEDFAQKAKKMFGQRAEPSAEEVRKKKEEDNAAEAREDWINQMRKRYISADNKIQFAQTLVADSNIEIYEVVALLYDFCEGIFRDLTCGNAEKAISCVKRMDWDGVEATLDYIEELRNSNEWCAKYDNYSLWDNDFESNQSFNIGANHLWRVLLSVLRDDWHRVGDGIREGIPLEYDPIYYSYIMLPIWDVARACWNLGKCQYIIPLLLDWLKEEEESPAFNERESISIFETIIEFATMASLEVSEGSAQHGEFLKTVQEYQTRIKYITGKNYTLKRDTKKRST